MSNYALVPQKQGYYVKQRLTPEDVAPLLELLLREGRVVGQGLLHSLAFRLVMLYDLYVRVLQVSDSQACRILRVSLTLARATVTMPVLLRVSPRTSFVSISVSRLRPP